MISTTTRKFDDGRILNADGLEVGLMMKAANRVLRVSPGGTDFSTLTAAKNVAVAGDLIAVMPGTYAENNLLKNGVNWFFYPGAVVNFQATAVLNAHGGDTVPNDTTTVVYGIFDDRSSGACVCTIGGHGSFYVDNRGFTQLLGTLVVTNVNSKVSITGKDIGYNIYADNSITANGSRSAVYVSNGIRVDVNVDKIYGAKGTTFNTGQLDTFSSPIFWSENGTGVYWQLGPLYVHCGTIEKISAYGVWGDQPIGNTTPADMWITADFIENHIYMDGGSNGAGAVGVYTWRTWMTVKELGEGAAYFDYGRHYLTCEKIDCPTVNMSFNGAVHVWVTCQKLTNVGGGGWMLLGPGNPSGTGCPIVWWNGQQLEDTQGFGVNGMIAISGATTELHMSGVHMKTNALLPGILHAGGKTRLSNCTIEMTLNNVGSPPVKVSGAGCILDRCTLICGAAADSVTAVSAQTITSYGTKVNKAKNANITVNVDALVADANVV